MLILSESTIAALADPIELTDQMEKALLTYESGQFTMPDRVSMDFDSNSLLLMPARIDNYFSTKLVSLFPNNPSAGLPVIHGCVVLNDGASGKPIAVINGGKLTAVRTAAVGSAGIRFLSPANSSKLGLIGAGVQGFHQVIYASFNRPIKEIRIFDSRPDCIKGFINKLKIELPGVKLIPTNSSADLVRKSEIIITATNASEAVIPNDPDLLLNKHFFAIGSYKPDMTELPDGLYQLIDQCFIDVDVALEESGDLIHPLNKGILRRENIHLLGKLISHQITIDSSKTTLFKSVGMALFDLFAAQYLYNKAMESGVGEIVDF